MIYQSNLGNVEENESKVSLWQDDKRTMTTIMNFEVISTRTSVDMNKNSNKLFKV